MNERRPLLHAYGGVGYGNGSRVWGGRLRLSSSQTVEGGRHTFKSINNIN
jgi:hypothetical protein